jgi:Na+/proline symporter
VAAGFRVLAEHVPEMTRREGYFLTGFEGTAGMSAWEVFRHVLESKYTLPAAIVATTIASMATFGTDQDMVQRMLTASDHRKSRLSLIGSALMIVPIAGFFTFIGVLLIPFFKIHPELTPAKPNDVFGVYILSQMPVVVRGFVLAGVFAAAMGSLSAALNALATAATNDWYIPYVAKHRSGAHHVAVARVFTGVFAVLMILVAVAFAYANVKNPKITIIPIALGIAGYVLGPMLGVFLVGMLTRTRGSDGGNVLAISLGLIAIFVTSGRFFDLTDYFMPGTASSMPAWLPKVEFTWYAMIGAVVTFGVGLLFRTPDHVLAATRKRAQEATAAASEPGAARS